MTTAKAIQLPIIGEIIHALPQKFGLPRQPNLVAIPAVIEMYPPYNQAAAFEGLEQFSHIWVQWVFHKNHTLVMSSKQDFDASRQTGDAECHKQSDTSTQSTMCYQAEGAFSPSVRPPRLGGNQKLGVFATRSMFRPAPIGLSVLELIKIEYTQTQVRLHVLGVDMVSGTPIIDIKPYVTYSDSVPARSGYAQHAPQCLNVVWTSTATQQFEELIQQQHLQPQDGNLISQLVSYDPRPQYQQNVKVGAHQLSSMRYHTVDVDFYQADTVPNDELQLVIAQLRLL